MGPDASTGPPGLRVERHSEANRLAQEFQAQAYEALVPRRRGRTTTAALAPAAGAGTVNHPNSPKGVAA
jgi:hypothetical protein